MPTETKTERGLHQVNRYFYNPPVGTVTSVEWDQIGSYTEHSRSGTGRRKRPVGWQYPTPYSMDLVHVRHPIGNWSIDMPGNDPYRIERSGTMSLQYGADYRGPTSVSPVLTSDALLKCMLDVRNCKVNVAVLYKEAGKTADLVGGTARLLAGAFEAIKRKDFNALQRITGWGKPSGRVAADSAANIWLSYRYGWKPLLADINGSLELLADHIIDLPSVSASAFKWQAVNASEVIGGGSDYARLLETVGIQSSYVRFDFAPKDELAQKVQNLGLENPLELQWELLPYSFVVDWFLPIGNALGAATYATNIEWISGSQSNWIDCVTRTIALPDQSSAGVSAKVEGSHSRKKLLREVFVVPPSIPLPQFRNPFPHGPRMMDSIALLFKAFFT
jgi:hypothetical protein